MRKVATELQRRGHPISYPVVAELLHQMDYSLQGNLKTNEGTSHADRNAQFEHMQDRVQHYIQGKQPVISVDTKQKELVGDFKNGGREWRPQGDPRRVRVHDFRMKELGRASPYGIYDLAQNSGWVRVGVERWLETMYCVVVPAMKMPLKT